MSKNLDEAIALMSESIRLSNIVKLELLPKFTEEESREYMKFLIRQTENSSMVIPLLKAGMGKSIVEFAENFVKGQEKKDG